MTAILSEGRRVAARRDGKTAVLRYTLVDCPLGRLLVAGSTQGVAFVYLGDADAPLEAELRRECGGATLVRDDAGLRVWADAVGACLPGGGDAPPLDVRGSTFQRRVWEQLRAIPRGETRTYRQLAEALGRPTAARAVARACATNPVSVVVPCHRVVRGDGGLGGYRWGLHRKKALLALEAGHPAVEGAPESIASTEAIMAENDSPVTLCKK
jgi:AraC family transcriptional regulator of adaptative response/methylated-DNA-[protein]-cysteine methyltransferase